MSVSYPNSVWDGDSGNRDSDVPVKKAPNYQDWNRMIAEVSATQNRVDDNNSGVDDDAIDSVGTAETVTGLSVVEKGDGALHKTIFTLASVAIASTDGTTAGTDGAWGTKKLYTFPEGQICILGAHQVYPLGLLIATTGGGLGFSDTADLGIGVGSAAAANSTEWGLSGTEEDMCAEADVDLVAKASDAIESSVNAALLPLDGSSTAVSVNLNFRGLGDDDHGTAADVLTVSGTITIVWTVLGNN